MSDKLTHVSKDGMPGMVDVGEKTATKREAKAVARIHFPPDVFVTLKSRDWESAKGAVFPTAIIAGTQAVKKTSELIPFCHPLPLEGISIVPKETDTGLDIHCSVRLTHKTGVEMEALTGATIAALTVIDMCKALSPAIEIQSVRLLSKTGGKRDYQSL